MKSRGKEEEASRWAAAHKEELDAAAVAKETADKIKEQLDAAVSAKEAADADRKLLAQRLLSAGTYLLGKCLYFVVLISLSLPVLIELVA